MDEMNSTSVEQSLEPEIQVEIVDEVQETTPNIETPVETPQEPNKIKVDGVGEFTPEEIKEFQRGYMRQQDYTRKTQEIAELRKQVGSPAVSQQVQQQYFNQPTSLEMQRIQQLEQQMANQQLDMQIEAMKSKYPDFDEIKVLEEAYNRQTTDLEFVYKATREVTPTNREEIEREIRAKIMAEIEANKTATSTVIGNSPNTPPTKTVKLSRNEANMAKSFGMSPEEYAKWR